MDNRNMLKQTQGRRRGTRLAAVLALLAGGALAYDPPEIIGIFNGGRYPLYFGDLFACVGDQNGDGYDDLLLSHRITTRGECSMIKLYYGGDEMDARPDFTLRGSFAETIGSDAGSMFEYLGRLSADNPHWIRASVGIYRDEDPRNNRSLELQERFYKGGEDLDSIPEVTMRRAAGLGGYNSGEGPNKRPADFNGDGYDDWLTYDYRGTDYNVLKIFHGGQTFARYRTGRPGCRIWNLAMTLSFPPAGM